MASYPIYIGRKKEDQFLEIVRKMGEENKGAGQGSASISQKLCNELREVIPKISTVSWNVYDCDGTTAFAIRFKNDFTNNIQFENEVYKGVVLGAPNGHLNKYLKLRW